jgi:hypothetical protein
MSPLQVSQQGPNAKKCLFQEPSFTYPSGSPVNDPLQVSLTELPYRKMPGFQSPPLYVSQESPVIATPQRGPYGESCLFPEPSFTCLSVSPVKVLLMKKSLPSLEIPGRGTSLLCFPKLDSYGKRRQFPEPYVTYPSGSPLKKPFLHVPLTERDTPFPEPSFMCFSKSLVNDPPLQVTQWGSLCREVPISRDFLYTSFRVATKAAATPGSPNRAPIEIFAPFPEPVIYVYISESMANDPPPGSPMRPIWREMPVSRAFFYTSPEKIKILPLSPSPR